MALRAARTGVLLIALTAFLAGTAQAGDRLLVFAAASLKNALDGIAQTYEAESGTPVAVSYAASSALARQIEQGAPADVYMSANPRWMDYLSAEGLTVKSSESALLGNRLVLVAPASSAVTASIDPGFDLAALIGDGRLAVAEVNSVPAGIYAKQALEALGVWETVRDRIAQTDNVRAALALVSTGEAPLGIVYETDAAADPNVLIVARFPEGTHEKIVYPAAILSASGNEDAARFLEFLKSREARSIFEAEGFSVLTPAPSN